MHSVPSVAFLTDLFLHEEQLQEGANKYSCVMAHLPDEVTPAVRSMQSYVDPRDIKKTDNDPPHVTVLYGLHDLDPAGVFSRFRPSLVHKSTPTVTFGKLSLFQNRDQDVLKIAVKSPDLHHLNSVARKEPHTLTFPDYTPHLTVALLNPGAGAKYLDLMNPLEDHQVQIRHLIHSNPNKEYAWFPIESPSVREAISLQSHYGLSSGQVVELLTSIAVGTRPLGMGMLRPIYPSTPRKRPKNKS